MLTRCRLHYPAGIIQCNCRAIGTQGVAFIELERFFVRHVGINAVAGGPDIAGKRLHSGGRQDQGQFSQMGAAGNTCQALLQVMPEPIDQVQADQCFVSRADGIAVTRVRHAFGRRFGVDDIELKIHRQAQMEVVQGRASGTRAGSEGGVTGLGIGDAGVNVP